RNGRHRWEGQSNASSRDGGPQQLLGHQAGQGLAASGRPHPLPPSVAKGHSGPAVLQEREQPGSQLLRSAAGLDGPHEQAALTPGKTHGALGPRPRQRLGRHSQ
ncbi:MAG: hypothetical protein ACK55I_19225, partial [bacterium]